MEKKEEDTCTTQTNKQTKNTTVKGLHVLREQLFFHLRMLDSKQKKKKKLSEMHRAPGDQIQSTFC